MSNVKNLGMVAGIVSGVTAPENKKVLWYDETITLGCPIKYYNLTTNTWTFLVEPAE